MPRGEEYWVRDKLDLLLQTKSLRKALHLAVEKSNNTGRQIKIEVLEKRPNGHYYVVDYLKVKVS